MSKLGDIILAFPDAPAPSDRITPHDCAECDDIARDLTDKTPRDIPGQVLQRRYDSLPLLSPAAWRYLLPAYLDYAASNPESELATMLIINLDCESSWGGEEAGTVPRCFLLSTTERAAVASCLAGFRSKWDEPEDAEQRDQIKDRVMKTQDCFRVSSDSKEEPNDV